MPSPFKRSYWPRTQAEYDRMTVDRAKSKAAGWDRLFSRAGHEFTDDDDIIVFHATGPEEAEDLLMHGAHPKRKPRNLARDRYEAGEAAEYAPGRGVGGGLYVGHSAGEVSGYGSHTLAVLTKLRHIKPSPEAQARGTERVPVTHRLALLDSDAMIDEPLEPYDIRPMGTPRRIVQPKDEFDELK